MEASAVFTQGPVHFNWRGDQVAPFTGAQFANSPYNTKSVNGRWRGNLYWTTQAGLPCAQLENTPPPLATPPWTLCAGTFPRSGVPCVYPQVRSYALAIFIPVGFTIPNNGGWLTMLEQRYVNVGGHGPLTFVMFADHVECWFLCGAYNTSTKQFQYNSRNAPRKIVARFKPGWNYLSWTIRWAKDNTGAGAFCYRAASDAVWTPGDTFSGFPTALWNQGSALPTTSWDLLNNYEYKVSQNFSTFYRRYIDCDLLGDAQGLVALP